MTLKRSTLASLALCASTIPAGAADWQVIPEESTLGIIGQMNGVAFEGIFLDFEAAISFDPDDPAAATIDVVIDTGSLDTDNPQRDDVARSIDLFYVAEYPTAHFTASGFAAEDGQAYATTGELTIRDATREVLLPFSLAIEGDRAHAIGELVINRIDFGVGQGSWASSDPVAHEISITIDIVAEIAD